MTAFYEEHVGGVLSPNANPAVRPPKPLTIANAIHEVTRTSRAFGGVSAFGASVGWVLSWDNTPVTVAAIAAFTFLCIFDAWVSRCLALLPMGALLHMSLSHVERTSGRFGARFRIGGDDEGSKAAAGGDTVRARLRVTVVRARGLTPLDSNGLADPLVRISLRGSPCARGALAEIGKSRTVYV